MTAADSESRFLIIGAGPVGLAMAKALKTYAIPYEQVDADAGVGGNWRHGVYEGVHIISSRRTTEFPDYPMPAGTPDFPSRAQMLAYLEDYARHFGLIDNIRFNTRVVWVRSLGAAGYEVTFADGSNRRYKGVLVANGHHWSRRMPEIPGRFAGELIHSKDYRHPDQLRGRRVLVIGGGNSACDIVSEAARTAAEAHLSLRRGYWFMPKTFFGVPTAELIHPLMPVWLQKIVLKALIRIAVGDYRRYGLPRPDHDLFDHHPTISTEILHYLKHGRITPHPDIARFDGRKVVFVDGSAIEVDLVIAATGFYVDFPFLPPEMAPVEGPVVKAYGGLVVPGFRHLYLIGWSQPRYGFGPLLVPASELVARLIRLQDEVAHPLGDVLKAMGVKPPKTHLADPHRQIRQMRRAMRRLPLIRWYARHRMKGTPKLEETAPPPPTPEWIRARAQLPVY